MNKSLIVAASLAAFGLAAAATSASAAVGGGLGGVRAHVDTQLAEHVGWKKKRWHRHHGKKWVCKWRHGHRHCFWRG